MFYDEHNPESPQRKTRASQFLPKATARQTDNPGRKSGSEQDRQGCRGRSGFRNGDFEGKGECWDWRNDVHMGDQGRFLLDGSEASPKRQAVRRQPTEQNSFEVNINRHRRLAGLTPPARRCAGERGTHVSAERNATLFWLNTVSPSRSGRNRPLTKRRSNETSLFRDPAEQLRPALTFFILVW